MGSVFYNQRMIIKYEDTKIYLDTFVQPHRLIRNVADAQGEVASEKTVGVALRVECLECLQSVTLDEETKQNK